MVDLAKRCVLLCALPVAVGCAAQHNGGLRSPPALAGTAVDPQFRFDDARLLATVCAPIEPVMPKRLFTSAMRERPEGRSGNAALLLCRP